MRWRRPQWSRWAARLGVFALGLNALVPIHLAFDLADALARVHHTAAGRDDDPVRRVLGRICGHAEEGGASDRHDRHDHHHGDHHGTTCPVCSTVGTLIALALPAGAALPLPSAIAPSLDWPPMAPAPHRAPPAAYRSRAPPIA